MRAIQTPTENFPGLISNSWPFTAYLSPFKRLCHYVIDRSSPLDVSSTPFYYLLRNVLDVCDPNTSLAVACYTCL